MRDSSSFYRCFMYTVELKVQIDKEKTSACTIIALLSTAPNTEKENIFKPILTTLACFSTNGRVSWVLLPSNLLRPNMILWSCEVYGGTFGWRVSKWKHIFQSKSTRIAAITCGLHHLSRNSVCSGHIWRSQEVVQAARWLSWGLIKTMCEPAVCLCALAHWIAVYGLWAQTSSSGEAEAQETCKFQECHKSKNDWKENRSVWRLWGDPLRILHFAFEQSHPSYIMSYSFTSCFLHTVVSPAGISAHTYFGIVAPSAAHYLYS